MNRRCVHGLEYRNVSAKNITIFVNEFRFLSNKSHVCAIERTAANTKQNPVAKIVCLRGANSFSQQYHNSSMVPTDVIKYPNICIISLRYNNIRFSADIQYAVLPLTLTLFLIKTQTSVYKGYKQDKIEMRGDRAEMSDFPLYLNTVAGGLDCRDQTIGGFSFVVKIYAVPVVEIIG